MDVWEILKLMARRWYFSVPLIVFTIISSVVVTSGVEVEYQASASIRLLGPKVENQPTRGGGVEEVDINPLIDVPPFLDDNAANLATYFQDPDLAEEYEARGLSPDFVVDAPGGAALTYTVNAASEEVALDTATSLIDETEDQLSRLQDEVLAADFPDNRKISTTRTLVPDSAAEVAGKRVRVAAITFALGLGATFLAVLLLEALLTMYAARRVRERGGPGAGSVGDDALEGTEPQLRNGSEESEMGEMASAVAAALEDSSSRGPARAST